MLKIKVGKKRKERENGERETERKGDREKGRQREREVVVHSLFVLFLSFLFLSILSRCFGTKATNV
jgi:hypothetical protein